MKIICNKCKTEIQKGKACPLMERETKELKTFCEVCYFELTKKEEVNDKDKNSI